MEKLIYTNQLGESVELSATPPFLLKEKEGFGSIKNKIDTFNSYNQDGETVTNESLEKRDMYIEGNILANSREELLRLRRKLVRVFNPKASGKLTYTNDIGVWEIKCKVECAPIFPYENYEITQKFLIQLMGPNPFWKSIKEHETTLVTWIPNLEFPEKANEDNDVTQFYTEQTPNYWLETEPQFEEFLSEFGTSVGQEWGYRQLKQIVEVNNIGDVKCPIRVVFRADGDVSKPFIQDVESYELIRINKTLKSGDILEITTGYGAKNVYLNGKKAHQYLDFLNSTWLQLKPGINLIKYGAENNLNNLECTVFYTPLYLGV